ncbi:MAG: hypothetical protein ABFD18_07520 [Syntrophomonas sp.]
MNKITDNKFDSELRNKPIVIKGCTARFNGTYNIDRLFIKLLAFVVVVCVIALIFL